MESSVNNVLEQISEMENKGVLVQEENNLNEDIICPLCSYNISHPNENKISEEDKQEYMRCILGNKDFVKTYTLMNNKLKITCSSFKGKAATLCNKKMLALLPPGNQLEVYDRKVKIQAIFTVKKIETDDWTKEYSIPETDEWDLDEEFDKRFGDFQEGLIRYINKSISLFDILNTLLSQEGLDANFWEGAGLA